MKTDPMTPEVLVSVPDETEAAGLVTLAPLLVVLKILEGLQIRL